MLPIFHYLTQHRYNILLADVLTSLSLNLMKNYTWKFVQKERENSIVNLKSF